MAKPIQACIVCDILDDKIPSKKVYEDDAAVAVLDINGANPGHCFVIPKNHYPIIEQVPDNEIGRLFQAANKVSSAIFESLGAQGTNIFVANGVAAGQTIAHVTINVIPRKTNDGINLQWHPKRLDEEEISTVELKLKEQTKNIGFHAEEKPVRISGSGQLEQKPDAKERGQAAKRSFSEDDEYFSRQMRRLP